MQGLLQEVMRGDLIAKGQHTPKGRRSARRNHKQFLAIFLLEARREICADIFIGHAITNKVSFQRSRDDYGFPNSIGSPLQDNVVHFSS
jgi:hypothetical protein